MLADRADRDTTSRSAAPKPPGPENPASGDYDVLIVGAGLSGIGVARRLTRELPELDYAVLEARGATGGTWDLFRFPGVRADSDIYTMGYADKPWRGLTSMPPGEQIRRYIREAAAESGVEARIKLHHCVRQISWSSSSARWCVDVECGDTGESVRLRSRWVFAAGGYYSYDAGFTPVIEGQDRFTGRVVHPQEWPEDLDYAGMRVVVIGSGATAITLVPALAERAALVTMVQRTPTYVLPAPVEDMLAARLSAVLGAQWGYAATPPTRPSATPSMNKVRTPAGRAKGSRPVRMKSTGGGSAMNLGRERNGRRHASREGAVPRRRDHEGRPLRLLRDRRAADAAARRAPPSHDGALSGGHRQ